MFNLYNSGLLRHPHRKDNPCYRKSICYPFFRYLKQNDQAVAEIAFNQMMDALRQNEIFYLKNFLEIYQVPMRNGRQGYLIIDPSNGFFPLVQDPNSRREFRGRANNTRELVFKVAVNKLQKNRGKIFEILNKHDEWTHELEAELEKWFEYSKDGFAANDLNFSSGDIRKRS